MKRKTMKRKTIKHKTMKHKYIKRKSVKTNKYTYKKGGAFLATTLMKSAGKKMLKDAAKDPKKLMGQAQGMLKGIAPQEGSGVSRQGPSLLKSALPKMDLSKIPQMPQMPQMDSEKDIKYYFKKGMYALYKVMSALITMPIRNLDEVIPPELCKKFANNKFVCSQSVVQYLLTGSKQDYKKILLEKDKNDCIEFDEVGNKIIKCKQSGGKLNQRGGNIIIGCDKTTKPTFKKNDRVIVLDENGGGAYIELDDKQWFIGTVTSATDKYTIQVDGGGIIIKDYEESKDKMSLYNNDWKDFYKEFYNLPKMVLQDLYDIGYSIGHPLIKRLNQILKIIYKKSGLFTIVRIFSILSKNIWQCHVHLLRMDKENKIFIAMNNLLEIYTARKYGGKKLNTIIIFNSIMMIYEQYLKGKSIDQTLAELDDNAQRLQSAVDKKLKIVKDKLVQFNLYLRKYECPMNKLESLIDKINNPELLIKMLETCDVLLGENNYENLEGDETQKRRNRIESCDSKYKYDLSINPDTTHLDFNIDPDKEPSPCASCASNKWAEVVVRYGCFFTRALNGSRNNMTYILINIIQDMATLNNSNSESDDVIENIKHILKNIECRSNLREVISNRINKLNAVPNALPLNLEDEEKHEEQDEE